MTWVSPVQNPFVTSPFDPTRLHPIYRVPKPHTGTDFRAPTGTPIYAACDGVVERSGYDKPRSDGGTGAGNHIRLNHGDFVTTRYYHLSERKVWTGQRVKAGQLIGLAGSTGDSTGPHLHFEVRVHNTPVDPVPWLASRVTTVSDRVELGEGVDVPDFPSAPEPLEEDIVASIEDLRQVVNEGRGPVWVFFEHKGAWYEAHLPGGWYRVLKDPDGTNVLKRRQDALGALGVPFKVWGHPVTEPRAFGRSAD